MITEANFPEGKEKVMSAFNKLLAQYQKAESKIATKEEEAEKNKNQQLLNKATEYTVDNIVNGMASLQLDFGVTVDSLKDQLTEESTKLSELKRAITVEKEHLQQLSQVRLVADALHILQQEHQEKLQKLIEKTDSQQEKITQETIRVRKNWEEEAAAFLITVAEEDELIAQIRKQEEADYNYELARQRQIEEDDYQEDKRQQERELLQIEREKLQDWAKREQSLTYNQAEYTQNIEKIANFEEKIKTEFNKAKGDAIKEAERKAKVETDLIEKEWESVQKGYDFQIESLELKIAKQEQQIAELMAQLQESNTQSQSLAMRAFAN